MNVHCMMNHILAGITYHHGNDDITSLARNPDLIQMFDVLKRHWLVISDDHLFNVQVNIERE
jgi:hypothetical protein